MPCIGGKQMKMVSFVTMLAIMMGCAALAIAEDTPADIQAIIDQHANITAVDPRCPGSCSSFDRRELYRTELQAFLNSRQLAKGTKVQTAVYEKRMMDRSGQPYTELYFLFNTGEQTTFSRTRGDFTLSEEHAHVVGKALSGE